MIQSLAVLLSATILSAQSTPQAPSFRLDGSVRPVRYAVELKLVPTEESFTGQVTIDLDVRQATRAIWMHGHAIKVSRAELETPAGKQLATAITSPGDFLGFQVDRPVTAGTARLTVAYSGKISSKSSEGIFRNQDHGEWYIYTQFESTQARAAFPCFDEPGYKVPWQLTLQVKKEHAAFSNTPIVSETTSADGFKTVRFSETKPLPSYLVAFAAGPFDIVDAGKAGRKQTPLRIIVPKGHPGEAKWAIESTGRLLELLENYFGISYPYEKLDHVAVPLFGGAMENPGLITYGLTLILSKLEDDTINRRRDYTWVAAHEMAHMWFGDLVTMTWWDDVWLNESFATWMSGKITAQFRPDWDWNTVMAGARLGAMNSDSLVTARSIRQAVTSPHDIANAFDGITYEKGGAVLHMFEHWIGPSTFQRGVKLYLDRNAWSNATASDFLGAVSTAAGRNVAPPFSTFLDQPGVPVVSAGLKCESGKEPELALAQKRYLPVGSKAPALETWQIPVCYAFQAGDETHHECTLMTGSESAVRLKAKSCPEWVLLNDAYAGYYRSLYRNGLLDKVLANLTQLAAAERLGIVRDTDALVRSGDLAADQSLRLMPLFASDPNRLVTGAAVSIAAGIEQHLVPDELRPNYARFIEKSFGRRAHELGWMAKPGEDDDTRLLRKTLLDLVAGPGADKQLRAEAVRLARKWLDDHRAVDSEIAGDVLKLAARDGDLALWERVVAAAKKTRDEKERGRILGAMGSFKDPAIVKRNFELLVSGQFDIRQAMALLTGPLEYPETRALPFEFVKTHYDAIAARMPGEMGFDYKAMLPVVGSGFCSLERRSEVESFFKDRAAKATGGPRILAQVLERITQCNAMRSAQQASVAEFLRRY